MSLKFINYAFFFYSNIYFSPVEKRKTIAVDKPTEKK
jgi:hypothetical protein